MSAEATIAFYGIKRQVHGEVEIEMLENKRHPLMRDARNVQLESYWANFGGADEKIYLFIGKKIGVFGAEGYSEVQVTNDQLLTLTHDVSARLRNAGIDETPSLFLAWLPDV